VVREWDAAEARLRGLIARLQAGDGTAFGDVQKQFERMIWKSVRKIRDDGVWDDLYQDCSLRLWRACKKMDLARPIKVVTYVAPAISCGVVDYLRKAERREEWQAEDGEVFDLIEGRG